MEVLLLYAQRQVKASHWDVNNGNYELFRPHIDGLVQERRNSSALAMELRLSCAKASIYEFLSRRIKQKNAEFPLWTGEHELATWWLSNYWVISQNDGCNFC